MLRATVLYDLWMSQRGHLIGWIPVCLGLGIGIYFALLQEPSPRIYAVLASGIVALVFLARASGAALAPVFVALAMVAAGFTLTGVRAQILAEPVLGFRYYGPIEGRIVAIDRSASHAVRITLDQVRLDRVAPERRPYHVRVSLHGDPQWSEVEMGRHVMLTGHLSPPSGPAEPGGFDFRRMAWFSQLGAVGYTRTPVLTIAEPAVGAELWVQRVRQRISVYIREVLPGDAGGFAAAVTTGDRSGLSPEAREAMRASNLFHLISISGMHMGMLAGFVFGIVRYGVALIPPLALRVSGRKVAALVALPSAAFYLALAGRAIPTERAFIMVAVMLVAVLLNRRALSLRSVAIAATIVLLLRPESLMNPGFQMSFSAVVALVVVFGHLPAVRRGRGVARRLVMAVLLLLVSSFVAGSATAPYAAAHFNRVAHYGVVANLLAVPVMGFLVMPGAVLAAILAPVGLDWVPLAGMELGARWILAVADGVAGLEGSVSAVPKPPEFALALITLGGCFLVLWQGRSRVLGVVPAIVAVILWAQVQRPALLISDNGSLIGLITPEGRSLSKGRGDGFVAGVWLENDGSVDDQETAAGRTGFERDGRVTRFAVGPLRVVHVSGRTALAGLEGCGGADVLISNVEVFGPRPCEVYDNLRLRRTGSVAVIIVDGMPSFVTAEERVGRRLWSGDL